MMAVMNQPLPVIKEMPMAELMIYARMAAVMSGRKFD
jgi:hypothetical protein